jgi:hypothetical protein
MTSGRRERQSHDRWERLFRRWLRCPDKQAFLRKDGRLAVVARKTNAFYPGQPSSSTLSVRGKHSRLQTRFQRGQENG